MSVLRYDKASPSEVSPYGFPMGFCAWMDT